MKITRKRYVAMCDNRTKIMIANRSWVEWRPLDEIGKAIITSWNSRKTAIAALKSRASYSLAHTDYEIVEMTETIDLNVEETDT